MSLLQHTQDLRNHEQTLRDLAWKKKVDAEFAAAAQSNQLTYEQSEALQLQMIQQSLASQHASSIDAHREDAMLMFIGFGFVLFIVVAFISQFKARSITEKEHELEDEKSRLKMRQEMEQEKTALHRDIERHKTSVNQDLQREITHMHRNLEQEKTALHKRSCEERFATAIKMERQILELILKGKMTAEEAEAVIAADYQFVSVKDDSEIRNEAAQKVSDALSVTHPDLTEADLAKVKMYKPQPVMERMVSPAMDDINDSDESTSVDESNGLEGLVKKDIHEELASHFANRNSLGATA
ncbi:hypothetical protein VroAM7_49390 (plasmid) [Vibrio rotiferianus]|uniref:Uncharacterized protein n=1 Tax=Vibrio rotiferianus TaxID=190895 RepID=A0A510IIL3_9VIBR|nr:hypothetical protein [Vibrio rotiferianus]BBL92286.1 hypothetical protein VroAM7_49390 [Vibrio rotiferianus]